MFKILKSIVRPIYTRAEKFYLKSQEFYLPIEKLLRGGENGIRAAKYAELTGEFLRPSTSVIHGPHVELLRQYDEIGEMVLSDEVFTTTDYYKNALQCMQLTGSYFYDRPEKIKILAERFIQQYKGQSLESSPQPGQSSSCSPVWVRPIKHSSYYEVIDGNHRIARAIMRGDKSIKVFIYEKEPVYTPLQQLLLDCLWINKKKWLYQPIDFPELKDEWFLVRSCTDRLKMMQDFLKENNIPSSSLESYIDIGSSYGWFVSEMQKFGLRAFGMERDPFGMDIGFKVYGVRKEQILHSDVVLGLEKIVANQGKYDIVSCLSVLHHFVLNKSSTSSKDFIQLIDRITSKVLFLDTGEEDEDSFQGELKGWSPTFIKQWLEENTSFKHVIPLGTDSDKKAPFEGYYNRTLFACLK